MEKASTRSGARSRRTTAWRNRSRRATALPANLLPHPSPSGQLRTLTLSLGHDADSMFEWYTFSLSYGADGLPRLSVDSNSAGRAARNLTTASAPTVSEIKHATVLLLRNLLSQAQTLRTVPDEHYLSMSLTYYDDRTPADYHPTLSTLNPTFDNRSSPSAGRMQHAAAAQEDHTR